MRVYKLAAPYHRSYVDLRDFKDIIEQAVHKEVPDAKVIVKEDCYEIDKDISKGDAIRIGRTLASGELSQYCLLFVVVNKTNKGYKKGKEGYLC